MKQKLNIFDKVISFISPSAGSKRIAARTSMAMQLRAYDAAQTFRTDDWISATKGSANAEIGKAQATLREKARDAVRNNPYANQGLRAIVSNTVGAGIVPNIKGINDKHTEELRLAWNEWTKICDAEGRTDFYGQQAQILRSVAESGEVLHRPVFTKDGVQIQILESDFIDTSIDEPKKNIIQGVQLDDNGKRLGYYVFPSHPGDGEAGKSTLVKTPNIFHVYRSDRPGQVRGPSWFHPVIRTLADLNEFDNATLIAQKVSACTVAFVTTPASDRVLTPDQLRAKRESEASLTPASIRYLDEGESVQTVTPQSPSGYAEYVRQCLRRAAAGLGITYEAFTSDYSQVNYSSARMAHLEMRRNIEQWRWHMLIPQFCEPAFKFGFLEWARIRKGINPEGVTVEWVPPAWSMLDPTKEVSSIVKAVRAGITTLPKAIREQGYDPQEVFAEVAATNATIDTLGLAFDTDPRKMSAIGFAQAGDAYDKLLGNEPTDKDTDEEDSKAGE